MIQSDKEQSKIVQPDPRIKFSKQSYKYLKKLPRPRANQIIKDVNKLPDVMLAYNEEGAHQDIKRYGKKFSLDLDKMEGTENLYRLRVGDYRILYTPTAYGTIQIEIAIEEIRPRGDVYK